MDAEGTGPGLRRQVGEALRGALERDELAVHYQPRIALSSGRLVGAEALLRWSSPELGSVPPDLFVPVAEATGAIVPIGSWVLERSCLQLRALREQGLSDIELSVNVSALQLARDDLVETVDRVLEKTGAPAHRLELEVTEGRMLPRLAAARETLTRIRERGVRISLDDFGSGYAALDMVIELPLDTIKLDRSIVRRVGFHPGATSVARTIVDMAHGLGLRAVAEGVGGRRQLEVLAAIGCDEAQGFEIAPALPAHSLVALARRGPQRWPQGPAPRAEASAAEQPRWRRLDPDSGACRTTGRSGRSPSTAANDTTSSDRAGSDATTGASASACRPGNSA